MRRTMAAQAVLMLTLALASGAMAQSEDGETGTDPETTGATEATTTEATADGEGGEGGLPDDTADPAAQTGAEGTDTVGGAEGEGAVTTGATGEEEMDAGTYAVRLRDLEQRINELKEQIFRSKARLSLLAETVLQGVVAGAQAIVIHENRMSSSYRLVKAVYALDGAPIFNKADEDGSLAEREEFQVYNGSIVPGEHTLTVNLEYRGHGYGIFSYLKGYRFKVRSNYSFTAPEGRAVQVRVVGYEKGGPTAPLEERPAIRYMEQVRDRARARSEDGGDDE
jgi:hypothetical protein